MPTIKKIKLGNTPYDIEDSTARTQLVTKENLSNKSTEISSSSTDTQYPSAKAVYDAVDESKISANVSGTILQLGDLKPLSGAYDIVATDNGDGTQSLAITDAEGPVGPEYVDFNLIGVDFPYKFCFFNEDNSFIETYTPGVYKVAKYGTITTSNTVDMFGISPGDAVIVAETHNSPFCRILHVLDSFTLTYACFIQGMKVKMADGSTKAIEEIEIGDKVLGYSNDEYVESSVLRTFKHSYSGKIYKVTYGENSFEATWNHPVYVEGEYKKVADLQVGDNVFVDGKNVPIKDIETYDVENIDVYNLDVDNSDNYIIENCLAHNKPS